MCEDKDFTTDIKQVTCVRHPKLFCLINIIIYIYIYYSVYDSCKSIQKIACKLRSHVI